MNKKSLMKYIQANSPFYRFANLSAHSIEQLMVIKERIDALNNQVESVTGIPNRNRKKKG